MTEPLDLDALKRRYGTWPSGLGFINDLIAELRATRERTATSRACPLCGDGGVRDE